MTDPRPDWSTTTSPADLARLLRGDRSVLVLTHARPDGDALGSSLALTRALRRRQIDARACYIAPTPRWAAQIIADTPSTTLSHAGAAPLPLPMPEPDRFAIVDTGSWVQLEGAADWVRPRTSRTVVIDHHLSGNADMSGTRLLDHAAAAAAEIVADVCCSLLDLPNPAALPLEIAEPLYLGIATDTGWFRFSNTRPATLRLAAALREAGVDAPRLFQLVEQQDRPARLRLYARALSSLELHARDSIAIMSLSQKDFEDCRGDTEDTTGFASDVLSVASIQVGVLLTEVAGRAGKPPLTKASLRSKPGPNAIDVAALTSALGGGGHARAAGVKFEAPLPDAKRILLEAITRA
ncbi:MAG: bifunctional oligoribonuclease/PAP phosphatase NrnA [Phycisphaerales bacterium]